VTPNGVPRAAEHLQAKPAVELERAHDPPPLTE
jgi:hypothetical protein